VLALRLCDKKNACVLGCARYDVHFYASFALLATFPELELSVQRDCAVSTLLRYVREAVLWGTKVDREFPPLHRGREGRAVPSPNLVKGSQAGARRGLWAKHLLVS